MAHRQANSVDSFRSLADDASTQAADTPATKATLYSPEDTRLVSVGRVFKAQPAPSTPVRVSQRVLNATTDLNIAANSFRSNISYLNAGSTPLPNPISGSLARPLNSNGTIQQPSSSPPGTSSSSSTTSTGTIAMRREGPTILTDLHVDQCTLSRYMLVSNITDEELQGGWAIEQIRARPLIGNLTIIPGTDGGRGVYFIRLDNIADAEHFVDNVQVINSFWAIKTITQTIYFGRCLQDPEARKPNLFEGQIRLTVFLPSSDSLYELQSMRDAVKRWVSQFGQWRANEVIAAHSRSAEFRFEMFSLEATKKLLECGPDVVRDGDRVYPVAVTQYVPDNYIHKPHAWLVSLLRSQPSRSDSFSSADLDRFRLGGDERDLRSAYSSNVYNADVLDGRGSSALLYQGRRGRHSGPHNIVDVYKIYKGGDLRTTVMLRNIPNKLTAHNLKQILDQSSFGRYDFSYLRIDFKNHCNVGYAFVNFVRAEDIIPFYERVAGRRWLHDGASEKVAEISYATIQGREGLIDKFRNSSVMEEHPDFRPKLWYVYGEHDPHLVGQEMPFPESNNDRKLDRSRGNAASVGLFPPRPSGEYDYRNRQSLFDRGTPCALLEEELSPRSGGSGYSPLALRVPLSGGVGVEVTAPMRAPSHLHPYGNNASFGSGPSNTSVGPYFGLQPPLHTYSAKDIFVNADRRHHL